MRRAGLARRPLLSSSFSRKAFMSTSSMPQTIMRGPASDSGRRDRRGVALAIVLCAQLMIILDLTVVNIALPSIAHGLHFSAPSLSWVLIAYTLTFGGLLLLGGRAGDILDRRRVFMAGIALFTAASLAGGLANSAGWLLAARAVQGAGGAIASPAVLALITASFAEGRERTRALGLYTAVAMGGASLGLVLGGIITEWASWRWVLFVNVPIGAVVLLTAPRFLSESPRQPGHFDIAGALTSIAGMAALVYAFIRAASSGWRDPLTLSAFGAAAVLLGLFLLTETRARQPITPLRLFADRGRSGSYLARLLLVAGMFGMFFFLTQFVQDILGFSPLLAGLLPVVAGMAWLAQISPATGYLPGVLLPMLLLGGGMGVVFVPLTMASLAGVRPEDSGAASSMVNVTQQVGGSLGLAILVTVYSSATRSASASASGLAQAQAAVTHGMATAFGAATVFDVCALLVIIVAIGIRRRAGALEPARSRIRGRPGQGPAGAGR